MKFKKKRNEEGDLKTKRKRKEIQEENNPMIVNKSLKETVICTRVIEERKGSRKEKRHECSQKK